MDKLARLRIYTRDYYDAARTHRTSRIAREWMEMGVPADVAAQWVNLGYLPHEAAPLIEQRITPTMARDMDEIATTVAGSREERAAQVIDGLVADGVLVDPRKVRQVQDPDDPDHTIVFIGE